MSGNGCFKITQKQNIKKQKKKNSCPRAHSETCNWFIPFPSPWTDFISAFALLLTPLGPPFLFNPLPSLLFASLISCISISQSFSASPEGATMTSEERLERAYTQQAHRCLRESAHLCMHEWAHSHRKTPKTTESKAAVWKQNEWEELSNTKQCGQGKKQVKNSEKKKDCIISDELGKKRKKKEWLSGIKWRTNLTKGGEEQECRAAGKHLQGSHHQQHSYQTTPISNFPLKQAGTLLSSTNLGALQIASADESITAALQQRPSSCLQSKPTTLTACMHRCINKCSICIS